MAELARQGMSEAFISAPMRHSSICRLPIEGYRPTAPPPCRVQTRGASIDARHRLRRCAQPSRALGSHRRCIVLVLLIGAPLTSGVSNEILEALYQGRDLVAGRAAMRVLPAAKINGDDGICGSETCWLGKNSRESLDLRQPGERTAKYSKDSYAASLVSGATRHAHHNGARGDLIDERILRVIGLLSPDAYFFAVEQGGQYEVAPAPSILAPSALPTSARPGDLVIVWRRVGLSFLLNRIDLDLCPTWETCQLGAPSFTGTDAAARDAARAKPLGDAALAALNARITAPRSAPAPASAPAPEPAPAPGIWSLLGLASGSGSIAWPPWGAETCEPRDVSTTQAAFAASPLPVFPPSSEWVLAASSELRTRSQGCDPSPCPWVCKSPRGAPRCWRTLEAAYDAVRRAEEQNPGYSLGNLPMEQEYTEYLAFRKPLAQLLKQGTEALLDMPGANFPVPGEKPCVPEEADAARWKVIGWSGYYIPAGKQLMAYPDAMECNKCLTKQEHACDLCRRRREEHESECQECTATTVVVRSSNVVQGSDGRSYVRRTDSRYPHMDHIECDGCADPQGEIQDDCMFDELLYCRAEHACSTWSGSMDPRGVHGASSSEEAE